MVIFAPHVQLGCVSRRRRAFCGLCLFRPKRLPPEAVSKILVSCFAECVLQALERWPECSLSTEQPCACFLCRPSDQMGPLEQGLFVCQRYIVPAFQRGESRPSPGDAHNRVEHHVRSLIPASSTTPPGAFQHPWARPACPPGALAAPCRRLGRHGPHRQDGIMRFALPAVDVLPAASPQTL